ncbi:MAG: recombinase family protein [Caulobacterales bacterium]
MKTLACAIYTRKSSEEGLEQSFNSLDAQREAGEAFVKSQANEGWKLLSARYDDGGFSGGKMERPALQKLLADIDAGRIDVVVVYKIDRLTRSLADFVRIVERFDARGASFVSVTQAFNTHTSMGRLTLNVLLSFAQFEREVTGERIRDKIAASKAKGLWMGGLPPLGYDLPAPGSRMLRVNDAEATTVRLIFERYLALGSVHRLAADLEQAGVVSKRRTTASGRKSGGLPFSRGALFHLIANRVYLGQITHKGAVHPGTHAAIVDEAVFERAQALIVANRRRRVEGGHRKMATALFLGRIVDAQGEPMSPTFSYGRGGRAYRYYVSAPLQQGARPRRDCAVRRLPAAALEALVASRLASVLPDLPDPLASLRQLRVLPDRIELLLPASVRSRLLASLPIGMTATRSPDGEAVEITVPVSFPLRGGRRSVAAGQSRADMDEALIGALRRAHAMLGRDRDGRPCLEAAPASPYQGRLLQLAFLDPDLQRDILAGLQPPHISLGRLMKRDIPLNWERQRGTLNWAAPETHRACYRAKPA